MECKGGIGSVETYTPSGINRNIVECKDKRIIVRDAQGLSINRNIVECKGQKHVNDANSKQY